MKRLQTDPIVALTIVLAGLATIQIRVYVSIHRTTQRIERAYVSLSHHGPGLKFGFQGSSPDDPIDKQDVVVRMKIRNHGNTPATVTRVLVQPVITPEPLPIAPKYNESLGEHIHASLVKGTQIDLPKVFHLPTDDLRVVRSLGNIVAECKRPLRLYVMGYVDYIDRFGTHHRAGYARAYNEWVEHKGIQPDDPTMLSKTEIEERHRHRNNLVFDVPAAYNYDRERTDDEGDDWDKS